MRRSTYTAYRTTSHIKIFKLVALIGVLSSFVYLIYYAAVNQNTIANQPENVPLIQASATPVKERAENPGGMVIPNENKKVFDLLEKTSPKENQVSKEKLCADEASDVLCNKDLKTVKLEDKKEDIKDEKISKESLKLASAAQIKKEQVKQTETHKKSNSKENLIATLVKKAEAQEKKSAENVKETKMSLVKKEVKKQKSGTPTPKGIGYGIQLASYGSLKNANDGAKYYHKKLGKLINTLKYHTEKVSVKGKNYYRVQMFGLSSKSESKALCKAVKAKGEGCMPIVR